MKNLKINKTKIKTLALSELILVSNTIERKYEGKMIEEFWIRIRIGKNKRIVLFLMVL